MEDQVRQHNHKQTSVHKTETKNDKGDDKSSVNHYDVTLDEDFVTSLEYGMPPASGMVCDTHMRISIFKIDDTIKFIN